ncbi:unnamed protein product [Prorocentrum cordatum]|uniref:Ribosome biogenesis protein NOP53 n=1 Tax=Prorocentrum cordatum TaxID=2364126 RepID=A0ABN9THV6_9DINO|nr:unnamed protein product [Polarella glacialis]
MSQTVRRRAPLKKRKCRAPSTRSRSVHSAWFWPSEAKEPPERAISIHNVPRIGKEGKEEERRARAERQGGARMRAKTDLGELARGRFTAHPQLKPKPKLKCPERWKGPTLQVV